MATVQYYFLVREFITTFKCDENQTEPIEYFKEFKKEDFNYSYIDAYNAAVEYFNQRLEGMGSATYFLPFAGPKEFVRGKNAAFSLDLLICVVEPNESYELDLSGSDERETEEALELRDYLFTTDQNK